MKKRSMLQAMSAAVLSAVMLLSATPAMAAGNYSGTIEGTKTTTFDKYLVMDKDANVPNASFTYTVAAGTAQTYDIDGKTFEVLAGVDADKVTMAGVGTSAANTIAFAPRDATIDTANANVKDFDATTQKYAAKAATLDFTAVAFTEPGIYRYIVTESGTNQGVTNDADLTRALDVYVQDDSTDTEKKLTIGGYVLHSTEGVTVSLGTDGQLSYTGSTNDDNKSQGFTNLYTTHDLTFRKEVAGNQASHDKYFAFTVKISNAVAGTKYTVDLTGAEATSGTNAATIAANANKANVTELTVGDDGTVTQIFYLQHDQEITIKGLADGTKYEVTENAEDYTSVAAGVTDYAGSVSAGTDGIKADVKTSYLNTREGIIPTGIMMTVAPFAVITLIGGLGAASILLKKKKGEDEEA